MLHLNDPSLPFQVMVDVSTESCADKVCDEQCNSGDGCLGPGNNACVSCKNKEFDGTCLAACQG